MLQVAEYENFVRKRITQLRHRLHVSEHKMSLDLGKSGSYMRSISIGKAMPSMHEFLRICEYLGVTPQEFFTGAGDETDRINIFNRLQDLDDGDIQKLQTFLGWIEYLSDDGKIIGYVTPFTDVDKFRKEILEAAEVGMPITPVVFPDKLDKPLGLPRDIYWPGGFRKEKRQTYPYEIYQTNNRNFVFRNYAYAKTRMKVADYKLVYSGQMERWDEPEDIYIAHNQSNRPNAQKMRSVSISDIIVVHNRSETQAFYVDEYGYRQVDYLLPELENLKQSEPEPYKR